jgi:hypothetical protein
MKVKDLLKALENVNPEMAVFCTSNTGEYEFCVVNSAKVIGLRIDEEIYEDEDGETEIFVIDEQ